jgi:thiamine-monophosphate kinase
MTSIPDNRPLNDIGERRLIAEVLVPRYASALRFGDDCANIELPAMPNGAVVVATTDPCPPPMAHQLGFADLYYSGWLLATINLSDLSAAGAEPIGLLSSLVLPSDMTVGELRRLLDGLDDCCAAAGTVVLGGNLKEAPKRDLSATALGLCREMPPLSRHGARRGDKVVVLGDLGSFWAGTLAVREGLLGVNDAQHPLLRNVLVPPPKVSLGVECRQKKLLNCVMDNSDGLYPTLLQLAATNDLGIHVRAKAFRFPAEVTEMAARLNIDPVRLALGFGDWQLVGCCAPELVEELTHVGAQHSCPVTAIGEVVGGVGVSIEHEQQSGPLLPLDSERFTRGSWFSSGLDGYIEKLRNERLVQADSR